MNDQIWQLAQILMWIIGIQTTILISAFGFMWNHFNKKFDSIDKKFEGIEKRFEGVEKRFEGVEKRFEGLESRMTRLEYDMIEIKTILRMKECCMIKDERQMKKAE